MCMLAPRSGVSLLFSVPFILYVFSARLTLIIHLLSWVVNDTRDPTLHAVFVI